MTKTLTEQWREGTLPEGWYYMLDCNGKEWFRYLFGEKPDADFVKFFKEVLGPVPNYMDCKGLIYDSINLADARKRIDELVSKTEQLEKRLEVSEKEHYRTLERLRIATKALKYYAQCKHINLDLVTIRDGCADFEAFEDGEHAREALKEMEGVK